MSRPVDVHIDRIVLADLDLSPDQAAHLPEALNRAFSTALSKSRLPTHGPQNHRLRRMALSAGVKATPRRIAERIAAQVVRHVEGADHGI